jgi:hypothetical protein
MSDHRPDRYVINVEALAGLDETGDDLVQIVATQSAVIERLEREVEWLNMGISACEAARKDAEFQRDTAIAESYPLHLAPPRLAVSPMPPQGCEREVTNILSEAEYAAMERRGYALVWQAADVMVWLRPDRNGNGSC